MLQNSNSIKQSILIEKTMLSYWIKSNLRRAHHLNNPILIYQMGKVGSTSAYNSPKGLYPNTFHIHRADTKNIRDVLSWHIKRGLNPPNDGLGYWIGKKLLSSNKPATIVTAVREPIARNLSAYFENLDRFHNVTDAHLKIEVPDLINWFLDNYNHETPLKWFEDEFLISTGIDVYKIEFNKIEGHAIHKTGNRSVLIYRSDVEDHLIERSLAKIRPELKNIKLHKANVGASKPYATTYKTFRDEIRLPSSYIDMMLNNQFVKHFYTHEEIDMLHKKWNNCSN